MKPAYQVVIAALLFVQLAACNGTDTAIAAAPALQDASRKSAPTGQPAVNRDSLPLLPAPLVPTPDTIRGLYVNRWAALGTRMRELIDVAKRTEVNALVIDVKDDRGFVLYRSGVPLAREIGAEANNPEVMAMSVKKIRGILDTMRAHGIYPIARIVVVKDPLLANSKPQFAILRKSDMKPWKDKQGKMWLDPHHSEVWEYAAALAEEAIFHGFSEVQLDYVRFPDESRLMAEAAFPLSNGRLRAQVIREQLGATRARLDKFDVPFTIDVFGLTTSDTTDMGIGQKWEMFVDQADVILPMTYPSHYAKGSYRIANPNASPYATIDAALKAAKRRTTGISGAGKIIPWYQDFTLGPPRYGPAEVKAQIKAGMDNGIPDWILWNPRSVYTIGALKQ